MKLCNICHKISATDQDHLDCVQRRSIETEAKDFKNNVPEKLNLSKDTQEIDVGVKAILEHLSKRKDLDE